MPVPADVITGEIAVAAYCAVAVWIDTLQATDPMNEIRLLRIPNA